MTTLTVTPRTITGKTATRLAKEGQMPAVVYGPKQESTPIALSVLEFKRILRDEGDADFYAIEKGAKVEVAVPISFIGESAAVKAGANLVKVMHELEIEAGAADLPHEIEVDISALENVGDQIHVSDIKLPKGVVAQVEGDEVVALIQETEVEPEEPTSALDMDSIEVEKKGKTEESDGDGAAA